MAQIVHFHDWTLQVDAVATGRAYSRLESGEAEACGCADCLNWVRVRHAAFPASFVTFIQSLGADLRKETEIAEYESGGIDPGRNLYAGEFLFFGKILIGLDSFHSTDDGRSCVPQLVSVDGMRVGVSSNLRWAMSGPAMSQFQPLESCAVVAFQVHAPRSSPYPKSRSTEA